jgi:hypothetical protein
MENYEDLIIAIIAGILLLVSESLPFIKQIKSNGIIHFIINIFKILLKKKEENEETDENSSLLPRFIQDTIENSIENSRIEPNTIEKSVTKLLENSNFKEILDENSRIEPNTIEKSVTKLLENSNFKEILDENSKKVDKIEKNCQLNQSQMMNIYDNLIDSKKIQTSEKYEIDYIIRYIRTSYPEKHMEMHNLSENTKNTLISLGYRVDYDAIANMSVIKW